MRPTSSLRSHARLTALLAPALLSFTACNAEDAIPSMCAFGSLDPSCQTATTGDTGTATGTTDPTDSGQTPLVVKDLPCDVAPILKTYCQDCHGVATQWGAPMSLVQSSDFQAASITMPGEPVSQRALARLADTQTPMPPPQSPQPSEAELATLTAWLQSGAPPAAEGAGCGVEVTSGSDGGSTGTTTGTTYGDSGTIDPNEPLYFPEAPEDCTEYHMLTAHGGDTSDDPSGYKVPIEPLDSGNQYMCFYFKPPYEEGSQGLWFDPVIDDSRVLHHWLLYGTNSAAHPDGSRGACSAAEPGAYLLAGWAPGADSYRYPSDVGLKMPSGGNTGLILEVHYYNTQKIDTTDRSGVKFCTAPGGTREHTAGVHFLGSEAICIQPNQTQKVTGTCDPRKDAGDIHILNLWPHMHYLGRNMKAVIRRADGTSETLFDNPFDFNNQVNYPQDDVIIKPGDQIDATCTFFNDTDAPAHFGDRTQDEMCYLFTTAWPVDALSNDPTGKYSTYNPLNGIAAGLQPAQRCLDPVGIFSSCNGLADYPTSF